MKANELRLGNLFWVLHEESETVTTAAIQHLQSLQEYEDDPDDERWSRGGPNDYYAGIPLSKDWLERLGFEEHKGVKTYTIAAMTSKDRQTGFILKQCENGSYTPACYTDIHEEIWYVHQLQNLFFALTGTELTIIESHASLNSK